MHSDAEYENDLYALRKMSLTNLTARTRAPKFTVKIASLLCSFLQTKQQRSLTITKGGEDSQFEMSV